MSLYVIGDLHLSFGVNKPMNIFKGWENHVERIERSWRSEVSDDDTVVLAGDTSWGMNLDEALEDFRFIDSLPGKKYILKGNHDYWWNSKTKMEKFFSEHELHSLNILHNNSFRTDNGVVVCASRGWLFENGEPHDKKILDREAGRLEMSLKDGLNKCQDGDTIVVFMHYPPVFANEISEEILNVLKKYEIKHCFYGHIHGVGCRYALNGVFDSINFKLISADALGFRIFKVEV